MTNILYPSLISSIFEVCITQPLDVMKIHYQTKTQIVFTFRELYKGFVPRALGNIPSRTLFLFSQDFYKNIFSKYDNIEDNKYKFIIPSLAGFTQTLVDTPTEVIKMNKIMDLNNRFLYRGFIPHVSRNMLFLIPVYNFKEYAKNNHNSSIVMIGTYGAIGGLVGSYISHPLDTIKTLVQTNREKQIKNLTIKDYFRGSHLRAGMAMCNMCVSLTIFELIKILDLF
jgi:hypothetical protein